MKWFVSEEVDNWVICWWSFCKYGRYDFCNSWDIFGKIEGCDEWYDGVWCLSCEKFNNYDKVDFCYFLWSLNGF